MKSIRTLEEGRIPTLRTHAAAGIVCSTTGKNGGNTVTKIRLGFVGSGGMGQCAHLRNYVALPDWEVTALAELGEELGSKVAARYGIPRVYRDHPEMLANAKLDGIVPIPPLRLS